MVEERTLYSISDDAVVNMSNGDILGISGAGGLDETRRNSLFRNLLKRHRISIESHKKEIEDIEAMIDNREHYICNIQTVLFSCETGIGIGSVVRFKNDKKYRVRSIAWTDGCSEIPYIVGGSILVDGLLRETESNINWEDGNGLVYSLPSLVE